MERCGRRAERPKATALDWMELGLGKRKEKFRHRILALQCTKLSLYDVMRFSLDSVVAIPHCTVLCLTSGIDHL